MSNSKVRLMVFIYYFAIIVMIGGCLDSLQATESSPWFPGKKFTFVSQHRDKNGELDWKWARQNKSTENLRPKSQKFDVEHWFSKGQSYEGQGGFIQAIQCYQKALDCAAGWQNPAILGKLHYALGNLVEDNQQRHYEQALGYFHQAGLSKDQRQVGFRLQGVKESKKREERLQKLKQTLDKQTCKVSDYSCGLLIEMGYSGLSQQQSLEFFTQAVLIAENLDDAQLLMTALKHQNDAMASLKRNIEALEGYKRLLLQALESKHEGFQAEAWIGMGNTCQIIDSRIHYYQQADNLARKLGDEHLQMRSQYGLGNSIRPDNLAYFDRVIKLARQLGDRRHLARGLIGSANSQASQGENQQAIESYEKAKAVAPTRKLLLRAQDGQERCERLLWSE